MGGILAQAINDTIPRFAPLNRDNALEMAASLRTAVLLDGWRGAPAVDKGMPSYRSDNSWQSIRRSRNWISIRCERSRRCFTARDYQPEQKTAISAKPKSSRADTDCTNLHQLDSEHS